MIPVLVDGVKKYLLTEEEVDAKISASSGGSSSENLEIFPMYRCRTDPRQVDESKLPRNSYLLMQDMDNLVFYFCDAVGNLTYMGQSIGIQYQSSEPVE